MLKRTLTALSLIPPVVYVLGWSPEWLFLLALIIAMLLALREYFDLCAAMHFKAFTSIGYGAAVALCVGQVLNQLPRPIPITPVVVAVVLLIPILGMQPGTELGEYLATVSVTLFGVLYIGFALSCLVAIRFSTISIGQVWVFGSEGNNWLGLSNGARLVLFLFTVIWAGDICAYLVGRPVGRTPFFARISPRKTWEGALAGLAGSVLAAWGAAHWFWKTFDLKTIILLAAWLAVAGQLGDLVESAIKRGAKQKDSGTLLPGHGGFLDRIDSLLFAAPALYLALFMVGPFL